MTRTSTSKMFMSTVCTARRRGEAGASAYRRSLVTSMYTAEMSFT